MIRCSEKQYGTILKSMGIPLVVLRTRKSKSSGEIRNNKDKTYKTNKYSADSHTKDVYTHTKRNIDLSYNKTSVSQFSLLFIVAGKFYLLIETEEPVAYAPNFKGIDFIDDVVKILQGHEAQKPIRQYFTWPVPGLDDFSEISRNEAVVSWLDRCFEHEKDMDRKPIISVQSISLENFPTDSILMPDFEKMVKTPLLQKNFWSRLRGHIS